MAVCINQAGTWRNPSTICLNYLNGWRSIVDICVKESSTWRPVFGDPLLGTSSGGGTIICRAARINWIVAPASSEVCRDWYSRNHAVTRASQVTGQGGWFIGTLPVMRDPGSKCRRYWDGDISSAYWTNTEFQNAQGQPAWAGFVNVGGDYQGALPKDRIFRTRALKCVAY